MSRPDTTIHDRRDGPTNCAAVSAMGPSVDKLDPRARAWQGTTLPDYGAETLARAERLLAGLLAGLEAS